ncbi:MAG: cobalamin transport system permease protein [Epulopiscium sp.]|uniref:Iron chelate uptake ABC transporter family permease subunit n=2 Tax=Defluviitalea raffinosedens TaxID=1450156 RepID=A0A7C8LLJ1_9FIRM|nr:iron ABC transporter permease [Defluviitalea raffinosedens]MBZ4666991.1 putative ABC-type Fe3+-siderophore transport system, permease component [Defluviitaleaceae bacterium]MDK2786797.1 cobalamin transport system permease protein [Candidatus Epulonipiscium sp.]KAE9635647.1 iron chelate uptake ABC transporter family permease subunit [Defluviitalea raffinosedens]MBM7684569.1 iron complex transport system permease protein [Defluviitalea raffinosedens]HHW68329.1 iron ABC transporter permease [C
MRLKRKTLFFVLLVLYCILAIGAISVGAANIKPCEVFMEILKYIPIIGKHIDTVPSDTNFLIVFMVRMPRIIMASIVGMGLAVVGTSFQSLFKNPMADPYVLGISGGAALGAALAITVHLPAAPFAFIGAVTTTIMVYLIVQVRSKTATIYLLLVGSAIGFLTSALISIIMVFNQEHASRIIFWMMGSFNASSWENIYITAPVVFVGTMIISFLYRDLNLMLVGEETAKSLGVETEKLKKGVIIIASMMIAVCVSFSGIIGFVGFLVPHMARIIVGPNNKVLIPFSALGGAIFLLLSDTLGRTIAAPGELPVGAVTALIGSPYFIYLLIKMKRRSG